MYIFYMKIVYNCSKFNKRNFVEDLSEVPQSAISRGLEEGIELAVDLAPESGVLSIKL